MSTENLLFITETKHDNYGKDEEPNEKDDDNDNNNNNVDEDNDANPKTHVISRNKHTHHKIICTEMVLVIQNFLIFCVFLFHHDCCRDYFEELVTMLFLVMIIMMIFL